MKKILPILFILISIVSIAQPINFPDPAFKAALISNADVNHDNEIDVSEAASTTSLTISNWNITNMTGIQYFVNLHQLDCSNNFITSLDLSGMPIQILNCGNNAITSLNLTACASLWDLVCAHNNLLSLDITTCTNLVTMDCSKNDLLSLDLSASHNLKYVYCNSNHLNTLDISQTQISYLQCAFNLLSYLNLKNGIVFDYSLIPDIFSGGSDSPLLNYVCADDGEVLFLLNYFARAGRNIQVDSACSMTAPVGYSTNNVSIKLDMDNNGCSPTDSGMAGIPIKLINDDDSLQTYNSKTDSSGNATIYSYGGNYTIVPSFQIPYYTISPDSFHFNSTANTSQHLNFCITPNGIHDDLAIQSTYSNLLIGSLNGFIEFSYTNKGTAPLSGNVQLSFNDSKLIFGDAATPVSAQSTGNLVWNFSDLLPLETRTIHAIRFTVPGPPINNIYDTLIFVAAVNAISGTEETPPDNIAVFKAPIGSGLLPVTIEYFKGDNNNGNNYLEFKATCTNTNTVFNIERSADGRKYTSIGSINADQVRCQQPFDFIDLNPYDGINYYRIKMIDENGKITYSDIIELLNRNKGLEIISLSPNPVIGENSFLNIVSAKPQQINIVAVDIMGRYVYNKSQIIPAGSSLIEMNLAALPKGIYTIAVYTNKGERKTIRFVKQ